MQDHHLWIIAAALLGIAEMLTGTFFLLVLAAGAIAGALAAWLGQGFWLQSGAAALVAIGGVILVQSRRRKLAPEQAALDVGQTVIFEQWISQADGMARVRYRGTSWEARLAAGSQPDDGEIFFIEAVDNGVLRISTPKPQH